MDQQKRYSVEIVADEVQFLSTKNDDVNELPESVTPAVSGRRSSAKIADLKPVEGDEDLPF